MSDHAHTFTTDRETVSVILPFELDSWIAQWSSLRSRMISGPPEEFTRDEWAYLLSFLDPHGLEDVFHQTFGRRTTDSAPLSSLYRPRGPAAIWLPNNASLLGPLMLILVSLTGSPVRAKAGSRAGDLAGAFHRYAVQHLAPGPLREYLASQVTIEQFSRDDPRNAEMSARAATRMIFGGDQAVRSVDLLPHEPSSRLFGFADHRSEAWVHFDHLTDADVVMLGRVFVIYGRAGCTSPARVMIVDGSIDQARALRDRLIALWPRILPGKPPLHVASQGIMGLQVALGQGWEAQPAPNHSAVLAAGAIELEEPPGFWALPIIPATFEQCLATLPANIQTVGHALRDPHNARYLTAIARTPVKRYVPLARMHHFGPVWDGWNFWKELFEVVQIS